MNAKTPRRQGKKRQEFTPLMDTDQYNRPQIFADILDLRKSAQSAGKNEFI